MEQLDREQFVVQPLTAVLATQWSDGRIHAMPVWYLYEDGAFKVITERGSQKHRNATRAGRATLCIDEREGQMRHVMVEGPVHIIDPVSYEQRLALHRQYRSDEEARKIVDRGGHEKMVMLSLMPESWVG